MNEKTVESVNYGKIWADRIRVCLVTMVLASIANMIYDWRRGAEVVYMPWQVWPGLLYMLAIVIVSCAIHDILEKYVPKLKIPVILYIALITTILSFDFCGPLATFMATEFGKIQLLPLCTPILAYAGISIGKDLDTFKKQGFAIVCTALVTFIGTWVGSALIADIVLKLSGQV